MWRAGLLAVCLAVLAAPGQAACRLALVLALDVSRSVDAADYAVQKGGLLAALADPAVRKAALSSDDHVKLAIFEWSGRRHQEIVLPWTEITSEADMDRIAGVVASYPGGGYNLPTAIGYALEFARQMFADVPECAARTVDVSGDGRNNDGMTPADAYRREDFGDILVNGLTIGDHERDITAYYRREVVRGPGAFVEVAVLHTDFPRAIRRKLERELRVHVIGALGTGERGG